MPQISRHSSGLAGLAVAPVFLGIVMLVTALEWNFLHSIGWSVTGEYDVPYPSATARGDFGFLQMLNFVVTGVLVAVFTVGFRREFRHRISGWVATVAFGVVVLALLVDVAPANLPGESGSWHDTMHGIGFLFFLLASLVGFGASGLALRGNPGWRGWRLLGWTPVLLIAIAFTNAGLPGELGFVLYLVVALSWFSLMGARLLSVDRRAGDQRENAPLPDAAAPGLL